MPTSRRVTRAGELLSIPDRHLGVLLELLGRKDSIVSKDALIEAVWQDVAVTDNSLEQAVSALRRALGTGPDGQAYIQTVPRQGYRFVGTVTQDCRARQRRRSRSAAGAASRLG